MLRNNFLRNMIKNALKISQQEQHNYKYQNMKGAHICSSEMMFELHGSNY